ncbi:MAG: hypothetical protein JKX92_05415 [Porticoccaceae bacterium]|nr:hypothetical protein [Porticoccaceae bacterium]
MASLLIKAQVANQLDAATCYQRGDVVVVAPDAHEWGGSEGLPNFLQLDVPGLPVAEVGHLVTDERQRLEDVTPAVLRKMPKLLSRVAKTKDRKVIKRRQFLVDLEGIHFIDGRASVGSITEINKRTG